MNTFFIHTYVLISVFVHLQFFFTFCFSYFLYILKFFWNLFLLFFWNLNIHKCFGLFFQIFIYFFISYIFFTFFSALTSEFCPQEASAKTVVRNSCLSFHSHGRATWGGALQTCRKLGGTLVQDINAEEQSFLQGKLQYLHRFQPTEAFYWIGLFRSVNFTTMEDHWMWTNGKANFHERPDAAEIYRFIKK